MKNVVIVRYSEIAVKGRKTRERMEKLLVKNIKIALEKRGENGKIIRKEGRIIVKDPKPDSLKVAETISKVFGVKSASPAVLSSFSDLNDLVNKALEYFSDKVKGKTFAVRARRVGKHNFTSKDVERALGQRLLESGGDKVDLENPEFTAYIEIRGNLAYFYDNIIRGPGGLPLGSEDPVLVLFSGGFDSTVSAWLIMRRGSPVYLLTFHSGIPEFLNISLKVSNFLNEEWSFGANIRFCIVDFSEVVKIIMSKVREDYRVLVLRRLMAEYAENVAKKEGIKALATGECIGQVASQTINNIKLIWENIGMPVLRPVIGLDKDDVMRIAKEIRAYDLVSKQIEPCGELGDPNPRASPEAFYHEYYKVKKYVEQLPELKYKCGSPENFIDENSDELG